VDHISLITDLEVIFVTMKKVICREDINTSDASATVTMEEFNGYN
jgi:undecaprenyl phosphate N,N'-diacetylbacillosamine 1-phosphate transferase